MRALLKLCVRERDAQATVEMAVVAPVLIVLALISYNLMVFACAAARFDRVAPDIVLAHGVAPEGDGDMTAAATVRACLADAMEGYDLEILVDCDAVEGQRGGQLSLVGQVRTYSCAMVYKPWPVGLSVAGVSLGAPFELRHERAVVIDPWRSGVVM